MSLLVSADDRFSLVIIGIDGPSVDKLGIGRPYIHTLKKADDAYGPRYRFYYVS